MLRISEISFPGLGIDNFLVDSEAFSIFGISIAWYAVIITFGMICAVAYASTQAKKIGVTLDDICDFALWAIPIGIVGARMYFVLTSLERFDSFKEMINIRNGGLAIYGGIIAGAATVFVVSKVKKIDFLALADCVAPGVLLAQGIGRWGNFMNGEAFGAETEGFLRMGISNIVSLYTFETTEMVYVHPTFLYESLWNLLGVLLVYLYSRYLRKKYDGELFIMIFGWYGLGRMFIEGLRMDSLYSEIFGLQFRTSQVLAGAIFIVCLAFYIYFLIKRPTRPFFFKEAAVAEGEVATTLESPATMENEKENFTDEEDSSDSDDEKQTIEDVAIEDVVDLDETDSVADEDLSPEEVDSQDASNEADDAESFDSEEEETLVNEESFEVSEEEAITDDISEVEDAEAVTDDSTSKVEGDETVSDEETSKACDDDSSDNNFDK